MDAVSKKYMAVYGLIMGMFVGGIILAFNEISWKFNKIAPHKAFVDVAKLKNDIVHGRKIVAYNQLKALSGGKLKKEDMFYALVMYDDFPNDTLYDDLRRALLEIYQMPPKDSVTLKWLKELDKHHCVKQKLQKLKIKNR